MTDKLILYTDGGARGNPGPAAVGVVIYEPGKVNDPIFKIGKFIGHTTNNQAEYNALLLGIQEAKRLGASKLMCYLDSELVVRQLRGEYKIKEPGLKDLALEIFREQNGLSQVNYEHVPREKNKLADQLVNEALDNAGF